MTTTKEKITVTAIKAAIRAERERIGKVAIWPRSPPKTVPEGRVVVHGFDCGDGNKAWMQFPTDDIEPCECGLWLFGPAPYREKEGIKREIDALFSAPLSAG
jgi:hypothetical protein